MREPLPKTQLRSQGLTREFQVLFGPDGKPQDPTVFAVEALLLWLNGWEPLTNFERRLSSSPRRSRLFAPDGRFYADDWNSESHGRILALMTALRSTIEHVQEQIERNAKDKKPKRFTTLGDYGGMLRRYATFPTLVFYGKHVALAQRTPDSEYHQFVRAEGPIEMKPWGPSVPGEDVPPPTPRGEVMAAHALMDIAGASLLDRIRQCACGTWFFAKRSHGVSCLPACRYERNQQTEAYRAHRRAKAAEQRTARKIGMGQKAKA